LGEILFPKVDMTSRGPEAPVVLVKWYDFAKWLLERVVAGL